MMRVNRENVEAAMEQVAEGREQVRRDAEAAGRAISVLTAQIAKALRRE